MDGIIDCAFKTSAVGWPVTCVDFFQVTLLIAFFESLLSLALPQDGGHFLRQCHLRFTSNPIWTVIDDITTLGGHFWAGGIPFQQCQTGLLLWSLLTVGSFFFFLPPAVARCLLCVLRSKKLMCWKAGSCLPELIEIMWMPFVLNPSGCAIKRRESAAPEERWEDLRGFTLLCLVCWEGEGEREREGALDNWQPNQNTSHNLIRLQWQSLFIVGLRCREGGCRFFCIKWCWFHG